MKRHIQNRMMVILKRVRELRIVRLLERVTLDMMTVRNLNIIRKKKDLMQVNLIQTLRAATKRL